MALHVVGVRHHSPACARLVAHVVEAVRPRHVLIEGPCDLNGRLDELRLAHRLPIAVYAYAHAKETASACWAPFCDYSPEWVALRAGDAAGAQVRFIDLPGWHPAFRDVRNRFSDRHARYARAVQALCDRVGVEDVDSLWDHLFEQPAPPDALRSRLRLYFQEMRGEEPPDEEDGPRETLMAAFVRAALADGGDVVVVCGGFHAPVLERAAEGGGASGWPALPEPAAGERVGSFLVPYSFHRLDSFTGYESGMPSPEYQQRVWEEGADAAGTALLRRTAARLRQRKQHVSAADLIAAAAQADGLRRLRGHECLARTDVLDGLASALVKDALDSPLPWTRRGILAPGTDPILVEVVAAFSGEQVGALDPRTPLPPLVGDVRAQLEAHGLVPERAGRDVTLAYGDPAQLAASRVLHRLRVLGIPGFERRGGPGVATEGELEERWRIRDVVEATGAMVEAAVYGATLESAAAGRLLERIALAQGKLAPIAAALTDAVFVGIDSLSASMLDDLSRGIVAEPSLAVAGEVLGRLLALYRHDRLLGSAGAPALAAVIRGAFDRGLWLVEGVQGATAPADVEQVEAVAALSDALRYAGEPLSLDRRHALEVMSRRAVAPTAPPAIRGAALGMLWACGHHADPKTAEEEAIRAVRASALPASMGDFLVGLFALAREAATQAHGLLAALDALLSELTHDEFLAALPALRLAFGYFPPREKQALARALLQWRGLAGDGRALVGRLEADAESSARGAQLDAEVSAVERRYGLAPEEGE